MKRALVQNGISFLSNKLRLKINPPSFRRQTIRDSQPDQVVLCILLGAAVGLMTFLLHEAVLVLHQQAFSLPPDVSLSAARSINLWKVLSVPVLGGLGLGIVNALLKRWRPHEIVDPIEANAIFGGRMSIKDSLRVLGVTLISNAVGASVGMEAAYTQVGAGFLSAVGQRLKLRREDLRIFTAAGAAAAIAAAFHAPLAGAFYGFELVLGTYSTAALFQVTAAALASALTVRILTSDDPIFSILAGNIVIPDWNYFLFILLGLLSACVSIATMKLVTRCEHIARDSAIPSWLRPMAGGMLVALIAIPCSEVLGSGQGAITEHLHEQRGLIALAILLAAKIAASAITIGSGFRGGMFSSSLFIGCLLGQMAGIVAGAILPETAGQMTSFTLVGMGSVAAAIIGAPVTMIMLVLEMTGNFPATTGVLAGVLVSSAVTRYSFGYSFSTWRFHLRGLPILGAHDVGWIREITVAMLMGIGAKTAPPEMNLAGLRANFPPGSTGRVFVVDADDLYHGAFDIACLQDPKLNADPAVTAEALAENKDKFLLANQDIRKALNLFTAYEMEELPVLDSPSNPTVVGFVTESYALRRYAQELEQHNIERSGSAAPEE